MSSATWEICCPVKQERIAVQARIASAWKKWTELASLLVNVTIPLKCRAHIYCLCIRSVLLHGPETWSTERQAKLQHGYDSRMQRYMSHVEQDDGESNEEVRRCGESDVVMDMKKHQLR